MMNCIFDPIDFNPKVVVVSCFLEHKNKILLLHRCDHKPQGNTWCMPAGKVDNGETLEQATLRELEEETGFKGNLDDLKYSKQFNIRISIRDYIYHVYIIKVNSRRPRIKIKEGELKDYKWVTPIEALKLDLIDGEDHVIKKIYLEE